MEINLVAEGAKFMVIGMTVVFAFLILMVFAMQLQSKIVNRFFPEKKKAAPNNTPVNQNHGSSNNDEKTIAAIMGAIKAFKNKHK